MIINSEHIGIMFDICIDKFSDLIHKKNDAPSDVYFRTYETLCDKLWNHYGLLTPVLDLTLSELISLTVSIGEYLNTLNFDTDEYRSVESLFDYSKHY